MRKKVIEIQDGGSAGFNNIIFDDGSCLVARIGFLEKIGISVGQEIDYDVLHKQSTDDCYRDCYETALHYLEYRSRSETELRRHLLNKRKYDVKSVDRCIEKLKEIRLIDDNAFAELWIQDRLCHRPKSRLMIKKELLQKGVDNDIANRVTESIDDMEGAYKAGLKKVRLLHNLQYRDFYKRLASYLGRRGYSGDSVHYAIGRLWKSICNESSE